MLDVRSFHFGIPEIEANLHPLDKRRPESLQGQRRLLEKWHSQRRSLHANTHIDPEELSLRQLEKIAFLVDTAFATHPFYYELYSKAGYRSGDITSWNNYAALPTISKSDIIDNFSQFAISRVLPSDHCYSSRTSGSTGRTLTILQDEATTDHGILFYLRHYEQLIGRERLPNEWVYEIYLAPPRYTSFDGNFPVFTVSQDCPPDVVLKHLKLLKPTVLSAFPSYLSRMIDLPGDFSEIGLSAICTNSEASTKGERDQIADRFGVPVLDEYASEELYLIATECRYGRYHIVEDNVRVDVLSPDSDGLGEIIATSLVNTYMPFIRYRQGDVIQLGSHQVNCPCGNRFQPITKFFGRADQFMKTRNGMVVPPDRVMGLYDRTLIPSESKVAEFQLIQVNADLVDLLVVLTYGESTPDSTMITQFCNGLRELFSDPNLEVRVNVLETMPKTLSHKRRLITNTMGID